MFFVICISTACHKDDSDQIGVPVSREKAIKLAKSYIDASDEAIIYADIIPAGTDLTSLPLHINDIITPSYDAWIIVITPNIKTDALRPEWMLCVNVNTGALEIIKDVRVNRSDFEIIVLKTYTWKSTGINDYVTTETKTVISYKRFLINTV